MRSDHPAGSALPPKPLTLQRLSICAGMLLATFAFGISIGSVWSGAAFIAALWCQIIGVVLLMRMVAE